MDGKYISSIQEKQEQRILLSRKEVQHRLLEVLRDLPVCTGVGVRRDVVGIEEFYSILSCKNIELNGFL